MRRLICDISKRKTASSNDCDVTSSPVQCMEKAFSENYELIAVQFATRTIKQRDALIELCAVLKRNPHTGQIPILALLPAKHRPLLEQLHRLTVDYARILTDQAGEREIRNPDTADDITHLLSELCPYLDYQPIDPSREMAVCKAYFSRMVIAGSRLHQTCQHPDFKSCPFFQSPKFAINGENKKP